jgi:putative acetyltransferase
VSAAARLRIEAVDPQGTDALALLHEAALDARALYPELFAPDAPLPTNPPAEPGCIYLVGYAGSGEPVGCAALRPIDRLTAEVRRVYVLKTQRGGGVARRLMAQLEDEALKLGYAELRLETGIRQQPAMALYESLGYRRIPPFGPYVGDPTSVCFAKTLPVPDPLRR